MLGSSSAELENLIADGNLVFRDVVADTLSLLQIEKPRTFLSTGMLIRRI